MTALTLKYQFEVRDSQVKVVVKAFPPRMPLLLTGEVKPGLFALWTWKLELLFERSVHVTVQLAKLDVPVRTQLTVGAPGSAGATVLSSPTLMEGEEPFALVATTRYKLLVLSFTARVEVKESPTAVVWAAVRPIAALVLDQVRPLLIEVCTWKLVSLFEASVQARVAWKELLRATVTGVGATGGVIRPTTSEAVVPVTFTASTR